MHRLTDAMTMVALLLGGGGACRLWRKAMSDNPFSSCVR